jgi:hypothetical protein
MNDRKRVNWSKVIDALNFKGEIRVRHTDHESRDDPREITHHRGRKIKKVPVECLGHDKSCLRYEKKFLEFYQKHIGNIPVTLPSAKN